MRFDLAPAGPCAGGRPGADPAGRGLPVQDCDLLSGHSSAESSGGGAGEET